MAGSGTQGRVSTVPPGGFKFDRDTLLHDFLASVVVFLVALPLCMGIAIACGVSPALGLITGIIGGLVVAAISGSQLQVSGPAAGLVVLVWELIHDFGLDMLGPIILLAGVMQMAGGLLGIGRWFQAISPAVVNGMLAGIGILIFASQFHVMVDDKPRASGLENLISIPVAIYKGILPAEHTSHHIAAVIGLITIGSLILWTKFRPASLKLIPGPLVGVALATVLATVMNLPIKEVELPDGLFASLNTVGFGDLSRLGNQKVIFAAFALAFVASAESLLSAVAVDRMHSGPRTNFNRELIAQGVGNTLCGFLGALPMTGVIVRSSANVLAGARTRLSGMMHGAWLLIMVVAAPTVLELVPTAALAAVLVHTGWKLVNLDNAKVIWGYGRIPFAIYCATIIGIVAVDLLTGVLIGIGLSIVKLLYKVTRLWIRVEPRPELGRVDMFMEGTATFLKLPKLAAALERVPKGSEVHMHIQRLLYIDHSCVDLLRSWEKQEAEFGTRLVVEWSEIEQRYHSPMNVPMPMSQFPAQESAATGELNSPAPKPTERLAAGV